MPAKRAMTLELDPEDLARRDRIAHELARRTGAPPTFVGAIRWALRELDARLDMERKSLSRSMHDVYSPPGPMAPPPERI